MFSIKSNNNPVSSEVEIPVSSEVEIPVSSEVEIPVSSEGAKRPSRDTHFVIQGIQIN